ncbi:MULTISPECIES: endonuclease/exonuclease/phosphatase family protein [unclassified Dysgonomonas]|uniref:endonuclease/exonuclease/phosphatase family protein n=1 Tax=unclassified Dysgonomonas TaxID=2630389 RepID=UPI0013EAE4FD|nr:MULTISPECIES: endonuclease/exonuclease/phosphatase family protein [unclassified Dysgonomonas]
MKRLFCLLVISSLTASIYLNAQEGQNAITTTIMSYNIRNGLGMDQTTDLHRIADVINHVLPNVVVLQEVDSVTGRNNKFVLEELGALTDMYYVYAPAIKFDGGKYGIGLLSGDLPQEFTSVSLPGREEERVLLIAEFEKYVVFCTHLSLTPEDQLASIPIIKEEMAKIESGKPIFFAGDLNALPESETISALKSDFSILGDTKTCTFPADKPVQCLDYIMVAPNDNVVKQKFSFVYDEPIASDHRPVVVGVGFLEKE